MHILYVQADGIISIIYVKSCNNLADPFTKTKALPRDIIKKMSAGLGLKRFI